MRVCVVAPMLNEIRFVRAWCQNVKRYADDVVVIDTGSTDGTVAVLMEEGIQVKKVLVFSPYVWPEAAIRNTFDLYTDCEWIVYQDADELVGDEFVNDLKRLRETRLPFVRFPQLPFWGGPDRLRARTLRTFDDWRHWYPNNTKVKMYRRGVCSWAGGHESSGCNPYLRYRKLGKWSQRICYYSQAPLYHYHYAFPMKPGDLRRGDTEAVTKPFTGTHPKEAYMIEGLFK